jgi:hypothetical protein
LLRVLERHQLAFILAFAAVFSAGVQARALLPRTHRASVEVELGVWELVSPGRVDPRICYWRRNDDPTTVSAQIIGSQEFRQRLSERIGGDHFTVRAGAPLVKGRLVIEVEADSGRTATWAAAEAAVELVSYIADSRSSRYQEVVVFLGRMSVENRRRLEDLRRTPARGEQDRRLLHQTQRAVVDYSARLAGVRTKGEAYFGPPARIVSPVQVTAAPANRLGLGAWFMIAFLAAGALVVVRERSTA